MPYSYPDDVPDIIDELPSSAQKIWVSVFNSVIDNDGNEEEAIFAAWSQVKNEYKKDENGNWVKKEVKMETKKIVNNTIDEGLFKVFIPFERKNHKVNIIEKQVGGKTTKFLRGVASNTQIDKEGDRMSVAFIDKMKQTLLGLTVFAEHQHEIEKTLGYIDDVTGGDNEVIIDVALEDENENQLVSKILKKIAHGIKIGFSVGGQLHKAVIKFDKEAGKDIREIEDGDIYEVSVTAMPAGNGTWADAITKSLNKWIDSGKFEKENTPNENPSGESSEKETKPDLKKVLDEIMQRSDAQGKVYELFWAFRDAMHEIVYSEEYDTTQKKEKIMAVAEEFSTKVEALASQLAALESQISQTI